MGNNVDPNVLDMVVEYDRKTQEYGQTITPAQSKKIKFSAFPNVDDLNAANKRISNEAKISNQRNIVDFLNLILIKMLVN